MRIGSGNHPVPSSVVSASSARGPFFRLAALELAVAGGAVGNQVAANSAGQTVQTVTNCGPGQQRQIMGFDVQYRYRGEVYESRLGYDPGERLRVLVNVAPAE